MQFRNSGSLVLALMMSTLPAISQEPQLRGIAEFQQVAVKANPIGSKLFTQCRPTNFRCVKVEISNELSTPILVDGDQAQAVSGSQSFNQATQKELTDGSGCDPSAFAKAMVAVVGVASAGLAAPIASEIAKKNEALGIPCGYDEVRLQIEEIRLGKRILLPGDKTVGLLCFSVPTTPDSLDVKITIPVVTKAPDQVAGQVEVQTSLLK
ncbi:MAG: hypothetical protein K2Y22_02050 [Candidatus Obscuribacterales bacterium]|nr:hypothetical protein [Candidatus Obscuribacterales bacterium]